MVDKATNESMVSMNQQTEKRLLLPDVLPSFAAELRQLLDEQSEHELAAQVPTLIIFDRCRCRDDIGCGTFYTKPKPKGGFGPGHRNVRLFPDDGALLILDVVAGNLVAVELLDRPDVREKLDAVLPDGQCLQKKAGGLDLVKPLQTLWQFVRSEFEMNYPSWFGNKTSRRCMKKQGPHEQSASPSDRARNVVPP
jgi:hypothetical protein